MWSSASPVEAQDAPCSHPACSASDAIGNACRIYFDAPTGRIALNAPDITGTVTGISRDQPDGCFDPTRPYGLQGWRYNTRGGHKIERILFIQRGDVMHFGLLDDDGNDYADGFVWLVPLPEGTQMRETSGVRCNARCTFDIDPIAEDEVFVLVGFSAKRQDGDGHVLRFGVGPPTGDASEPGLPITFMDDRFNYDVILQYAYVPASIVARRGTVSASYERNGGDVRRQLRAETGAGDAVLQGFDFVFRNGGHFIEDIGIERREAEYEAWFQDNQGEDDRRRPDDPFEWRADFVMLR
ncbi:hypothetical protein [Roseovarius sp. 2305UL8-3]|uniref:hypothetical protein n=1 Tax=Roseovarius conchicola TaxID=3121636 RepID=UPI00352859D2